MDLLNRLRKMMTGNHQDESTDKVKELLENGKEVDDQSTTDDAITESLTASNQEEESTTDKAKAIDLLEICRRMLAEWQYFALNLQYERLDKIDLNLPYMDPSSYQYIIPGVDTVDSARARMTAATSSQLRSTMYTVCFDVQKNEMKVSTIKNFFSQYPKASSWSIKKKEKIYWGIRLRYISACSIKFCRGILKLGTLLQEKNIGYVGWKLPNGQVIPLENLWIGYVLVKPSDTKLTMVQTVQIFGPVQVDVIDPFDGIKGLKTEMLLPSNHFPRHVLVAKHVDDDEFDIIDPVSMQFGIRGPSGDGLIMHGSWKEYQEVFKTAQVGEILHKNLEKDQVEIDLSQIPGMSNEETTTEFLDQVASAVLAGLGKDCCSYCGEIERMEKDGEFGDAVDAGYNEIKLFKCGQCKKVQYCGSMCQKSHWAAHKGNCI